MRRPISAVLALSLVLSAFSGCRVCFAVFDALLSTSNDPEMDRQNAIFRGYENDKKVLDEHPSHVWNYSTTP